MVKIRAKFALTRVSNLMNGSEVELSVVGGNSEENKKFFQYTPSGNIRLGLIKPDQAENFKPGAEFYVDFTPVDQ